MTPAELNQKRVLVVGLGVSGASVVRYLTRCKLAFDVADSGADSGDIDCSDLPEQTLVHGNLDVASDYELVVLSPGIPRAHAAIAAALDAGVEVIGDIELFASVVGESPLIAVTGSNGKSTVVAWLAHALRECGVNAIACGNIGLAALDALEHADSGYADTARTESGEAGSEQANTAEGEPVFVLELSSYQLESVTRLRPLAAVALNVSDDHLDRYTSIDAYAAVKRHVYDGARCRVVNVLDPRTQPDEPLGSKDVEIHASTDAVIAASTDQAHAAGGSHPVCWHFALASSTTLPAANDPQVVKPVLCRNKEVVLDAADLAVPGLHNAANALTVLALAECLVRETGLTLDRGALVNAMCRWPGLPHRTALVAEHAGVRWYDDSKGTNVAACIKAIEAMPGPVVLIAGGLGKDADFSPLGDVAQRRVKHAILIGQDRAALHAVLSGSTALSAAESMQEAVTRAASVAQSGDAVLLSPACSSFDMFKNYAARGLAFQYAIARQNSGTSSTVVSR